MGLFLVGIYRYIYFYFFYFIVGGVCVCVMSSSSSLSSHWLSRNIAVAPPSGAAVTRHDSTNKKRLSLNFIWHMWRDTTEEQILKCPCLSLADLVLSYTMRTSISCHPNPSQSIHHINQLRSNHCRAVTSCNTITHPHALKLKGMPTYVCTHTPLKHDLQMMDVCCHLVQTLSFRILQNYTLDPMQCV